jgi:heme/copper-type cytochrome/quinol oxidase subunit 2
VLGDHLCGDPHTALDRELVVEPRETFIDWLARHPSASVE